jgi:hypothetical protein
MSRLCLVLHPHGNPVQHTFRRAVLAPYLVGFLFNLAPVLLAKGFYCWQAARAAVMQATPSCARARPVL